MGAGPVLGQMDQSSPWRAGPRGPEPCRAAPGSRLRPQKAGEALWSCVGAEFCLWPDSYAQNLKAAEPGGEEREPTGTSPAAVWTRDGNLRREGTPQLEGC